MAEKSVKIICIILAAVMALSVFIITSCSTESTEEEVNRTESAPEETEPELTVPDSAKTAYAEQKDEIVTANADRTGSVYAITSKCTLSGFTAESGDFIEDISELENIENKRGSEKYVSNNSHLYWENFGCAITYEGTGTEGIPVSEKITYWLNGIKTDPDKLAGTKGHIKIRFDYTNHTEGNDYIPFAVMTMLIFDPNTFSNISVSKGSVMNMGSSIFAIGYTIPDFKKNFGDENYENAGLDFTDFIEFEADTEFFELDFTTTSVSNGLTEQIAENGIYTDDSVIAGIDSLVSASSKLTAGAKNMIDVLTQYGTYLDTFTGSVEKIMTLLVKAGEKLKNIPYYTDLIKKYSKKLMSVDEIMQLVEDLRNSFSTENTDKYLKALTKAIEMIKDDCPEEAEVLTDLKNVITKIYEDVSGISDEDIAAFREYLETEDSMYKLISDYLNQISDGVINLETGVTGFSEKTAALRNGYSSIISAVKKFTSGISKFDREGIKKLGQQGEEIKALGERLDILKKADSAYNTYSGHTAGTQSSVSYIIQTDGIY